MYIRMYLHVPPTNPQPTLPSFTPVPHPPLIMPHFFIPSLFSPSPSLFSLPLHHFSLTTCSFPLLTSSVPIYPSLPHLPFIPHLLYSSSSLFLTPHFSILPDTTPSFLTPSPPHPLTYSSILYCSIRSQHAKTINSLQTENKTLQTELG